MRFFLLSNFLSKDRDSAPLNAETLMCFLRVARAIFVRPSNIDHKQKIVTRALESPKHCSKRPEGGRTQFLARALKGSAGVRQRAHNLTK